MILKAKVGALLFLGFVSPGCVSLRQSIIAPPSYDPSCNPSDSYYLDLARTDRYLADLSEVPKDPQAALDLANRIVAEKGYQVVRKSEAEPAQWSRFTTTLQGTLFLGSDWDRETTRAQATTMWHELVHMRQWEDLGPEKMTLTYLVAEGRWALETQAYRETLRIQRHFGATEEEVQAWIPQQIESLYTGYFLDAMPRECMASWSEKIWLEEMP